jgi:hypothetical protein
MAQHDYIISNASFPAVRTDLNNALSAIQTTNSGSSRPTGAVAGQLWLDTTSATAPILKLYDGADDISIATFNYTTNTVDILDSTLSTPLAVTGNATAGAELRLPEDTDNGANYIAIKAPDTIASNLTLTLPSTDGTNGQALVTNGTGTLAFATVAVSLTYTKGTFTGNGSSTTITINSGRAVDNILVFVNGICLVPTDDYTISGTTLTFATAPVNLAEITVRYLPI